MRIKINRRAEEDSEEGREEEKKKTIRERVQSFVDKIKSDFPFFAGFGTGFVTGMSFTRAILHPEEDESMNQGNDSMSGDKDPVSFDAMDKREFDLKAVLYSKSTVGSKGWVQILSHTSWRYLNCLIYEKAGRDGFNFKGNWYYIDECIDSNTVVHRQ